MPLGACSRFSIRHLPLPKGIPGQIIAWRPSGTARTSRSALTTVGRGAAVQWLAEKERLAGETPWKHAVRSLMLRLVPRRGGRTAPRNCKDACSVPGTSAPGRQHTHV